MLDLFQSKFKLSFGLNSDNHLRGCVKHLAPNKYGDIEQMTRADMISYLKKKCSCKRDVIEKCHMISVELNENTSKLFLFSHVTKWGSIKKIEGKYVITHTNGRTDVVSASGHFLLDVNGQLTGELSPRELKELVALKRAIVFLELRELFVKLTLMRQIVHTDVIQYCFKICCATNVQCNLYH